MGKGSSKSPTQEGAAHIDGKAPDQVQRSLKRTSQKVTYRLQRAREHERVRQVGRRAHLPLLTIWKAAGTTAHVRVGIVVPLHGKSAVARNRLKRRLHYILRSEILPRSEAYDAVVRARPSAYSASFESLRRCMTEALLA